MVRRNSKSNEDSLDLLLDTLTNSLGAFLLVALLIALLVTDTSRSEPAPTDAQLQVLENLELEIDTFLHQAANLQTRIDFIYSEVKKLPATISEEEVHLLKGQLAEIIELQEEQTKALIRIIELNAAIVQLADENFKKKAVTERENKLKDRIDEIVKNQSAKMRELKKEVESAQRLLRSLKEQLVQKQSDSGKQNREVLFPRVSSTNKQQFVIILKTGWLYNLKAENIVQSDTGYLDIRGNKYRLTNGVKVADVRNIVGIITAGLSGANVNTDYIKIFIWDDSFATWNAIRMDLARRGYKYDLTPMDKTQVILIGGGSSSGRVQ
jgi:hypothetical protein